MITINCGKCGHSHEVAVDDSGTFVKCEICKTSISVPNMSSMSFGYFADVTFKADGITPDFDALFQALAKEEREAPPLIAC